MKTRLHSYGSELGKKIIAIPLTLLILVAVLILPIGNLAQAASDHDFSVAINADPVTLDPAKASDTNSLLVTSQVYETLVNYAPGSSQIQPGLAQTWSTSSDGLTWTFTLRSGVKFQDGTNLDASAVLFNFERWWDPDNAYHSVSFDYFSALIGFKGSDSLITSLNATSTQFIIVLKHPAGLLGILAMPSFAIASPTAIQNGTLDNHPVGSGPFQFGQRTSGLQIRLDPYPDYQGSAPNPASLTFKVLATSTEQLAALQSNSVQSAGDISDADLAAAMTDPDLTVHWRPSDAVGYLGINQAHTPFDKLLVRQAIAHAINKSALITSQFAPGTQPAAQFLPAAIWGSDPSLTDYTYDPTLSKNLLAQAGYTDGFTTTLAYRNVSRGYLPNPVGTANQIATDLAAVGITATPHEYTTSDLINEANSGNLDLFLLGWTADYLHPDDFFPYLLCNNTIKMFGTTTDSVLCSLVSSALTIPTFAQQLTVYQSASDRVFETIPLVPLSNPRLAVVTTRDLGGVVPSPLAAESYQFAFTIHNRIYLPSMLR